MAESHKFTQWGSTCEEMMTRLFPLHRACRDGDVESLSMLLLNAQHGVYVEDNFYGWSPAHWASYFGKLACLRKLMQVTRVGVDSDVKSSRFLQTPTHLAAFGGHPHCLQWLLQAGSSIDLQDYLGETPAHKAARTGSMECSSLLVSHGARLYICSNSGVTPSQLAENCGFKECAKFLESACKRQESDSKGVYEMHQENGLPSPSPCDITTAAGQPVNGVAPTPRENGVNGDGLGVHSEPAEMEEEEMDASSQDTIFADAALSHLFAQGDSASITTNTDITVNPSICTNQAPVAGCKRTREEVDEHSFKRQRTSAPVLSGDKPGAAGDGCPNCVTPHNLSGPSYMPSAGKHGLNGLHKSGGLNGTVNGFTNGRSPHLHNGAYHTVVGTGTSSSAIEHQKSVVIAQGYDSMCYEAMNQ